MYSLTIIIKSEQLFGYESKYCFGYSSKVENKYK